MSDYIFGPVGESLPDSIAAVHIMDFTPNPINQLRLKDGIKSEPPSRQQSMTKFAQKPDLHVEMHKIENHNINRLSGQSEHYKGMLKMSSEMYLQGMLKHIIDREKMQQSMANIKFNTVKFPDIDILDEKNFEVSIRATLVDLEKQNLSLRALAESQQQEIEELVQTVERLNDELKSKNLFDQNSLSRSFSNRFEFTNQMTKRQTDVTRGINYDLYLEQETIRNLQQQDKIIALGNMFQKKEAKMLSDIEDLVAENTQLISKYNLLIDQLRQMQSTLDQIGNENKFLAVERDKLTELYNKMQQEYDELSLSVSHGKDSKQSFAYLEENLSITRNELINSQQQVTQLREQLNNVLISSQKQAQADVNKFTEALLKLQNENEKLLEKIKYYEGLKDLSDQVSELTQQLESERYLIKQLESKNHQQERQIMESQYERERYQQRISELEHKLQKLTQEENRKDNDRKLQELKINYLEEQIQQYKEQKTQVELSKKELESQIARLHKDVDSQKDKLQRVQDDHVNQIGEMKKQLQSYFTKTEERYRIEKNLSNQKSKLEEALLSLNRQLIEKDKQLSLSLIERAQLSEQIKEREIDLERARSKIGETELMKQQVQYHIQLLEQSKLRELDLQRKIYDLENKQDDFMISSTIRTTTTGIR